MIHTLYVILAVEYCRELRAENKKLKKETEKMKEEISQLTAEIRYVVLRVLLVLAFAIIRIFQQVCIPVGCVPPACCPYLPACTAAGCEQNS